MQRFIGIIGIIVILAIAYLFSTDRKRINFKTVGMGLLLQVALAVFIFRVPLGQMIFLKIGKFIEKLLEFAIHGGQIVFGGLLEKPFENAFCGGAHVFTLQLICSSIFMMILVNILYYYGIMQKIVAILGKAMNKLMKVSGAEALCSVANSFVGQIVAQIMIKPYLKDLTRSEVLTCMAGSMACISGAIMPIYIGMGIPAVYILASSVMAAPGVFVLTKMMYPEDGEPKTGENIDITVEKTHVNVIDSISAGATDGMQVGISVTAMIIALVALVAMIDWILGGVGSFLYNTVHISASWLPHLSLKLILGKIFSVFALVMGVPLHDITTVGGLMGEKIVLNEMVAYMDLTSIKDMLSDKAFLIASFALCSFGNIGSIAIQIGGIGELAPEQRKNLAQLGVRALVCGTLTCYMSATIAGILF
jgi:CNT family concentrative nucleoside transporter